MTTIAATPDPITGTVKLSIIKTETLNTIVRADVNGTRPVRVVAGAFPSAGAGALVVTDNEPAFNGPIVYRAVTTAGTVEAWAEFPAGSSPRFTIPFYPELSLAVETVTGYTAGRPQASTVHEIIGREDPIIVPAIMKSRRGSLEILLDTYEQASDLESLLELGKTVMYRQGENAGQDFYFHATTIGAIEPDESCWKLTVDYVALRAPAGDRASITWTFATLAAAPGAKFSTLPDSYGSFDTLTIGQTA